MKSTLTGIVLLHHIKRKFLDGRAEARILRDTAKLAWEISAELAVYLPSRFRTCAQLRTFVQEMVRAQPEAVTHLPGALPLFLGDSNVFETSDVSYIRFSINLLRLDVTCSYVGEVFACNGLIVFNTSSVSSSSNHSAVCCTSSSFIRSRCSTNVYSTASASCTTRYGNIFDVVLN